MKAYKKLREARYFLEGMKREIDNREHFTFELNAFVTASCSIEDYLENEVGKNKYRLLKQRAMKGDEFKNFKYFVDLRNRIIHEASAEPKREITIVYDDQTILSESSSFTSIDSQGNVLGISQGSGCYEGPPPPSTKVSQFSRYYFDDLSADDLLTVFSLFIDDLDRYIKEASKL